MALLLGSLRGKFVLMIVLVFLGTALLTVLSFGWVGSNVARSLGVRFAEKQVLYEQARIRAPILREIALTRKLADSPTLQAWAKNEQNPDLKQRALAELESYRQAFQNQSFFFVVSDSLNYYYNDQKKQFSGKELRYALDPRKPDDSWYFAVRSSPQPLELNVDVNPELSVTNVWINTLVRAADGTLLGVAGTGLDLSRFVEQFIARDQSGITNILINADGAIQAHPERQYIDINSRAKQTGEHSLLFSLLPAEKDRQALQGAMVQLKNQPENVMTLFLELGGREQLLGIAYLPEMQWYNVTVMDPDRILSMRTFMPIVGVLAVALVLSLVAVAWVLHSLVLRRIDRLDIAARQVSSGNYDVNLPADGNDEMGRLADGFTRMAGMIRENTQQLENRVAERTAALQEANLQLELRNKQILDSIRYAKLIQTAILPRADMLARYLDQHLVIWLPRDVVGGDFYFLYPAEDGCYLGLVDCTGHGIPGAFMSMTAHAVIRQVLAESGTLSLPEILERIDASLRETLQHNPHADGLNYGMDIGLCRLRGKALTYAGCGVDLLVNREEGVKVISATRRGLGYRRRNSHRAILEHKLDLDESTRCYLASDGLLDQAGGSDGFGFGRDRLIGFLGEYRNLPLSDQQALLVEAMENYRGDLPQRDDITVLGFSAGGQKGHADAKN